MRAAYQLASPVFILAGNSIDAASISISGFATDHTDCMAPWAGWGVRSSGLSTALAGMAPQLMPHFR